MFGLVFVSDGQNEGPIIMALILIAQLPLLLCEIVSVCYTCTVHCGMGIYIGTRLHCARLWPWKRGCTNTPGGHILRI